VVIILSDFPSKILFGFLSSYVFFQCQVFAICDIHVYITCLRKYMEFVRRSNDCKFLRKLGVKELWVSILKIDYLFSKGFPCLLHCRLLNTDFSYCIFNCTTVCPHFLCASIIHVELWQRSLVYV